MPVVRTLGQVYHGSRDRVLPYSIVIRYGTRESQARRDLEVILKAVTDFATKDEAEAARRNIREDLRPFTAVTRYGAEDLAWSVGANGNLFADAGGHRYCVATLPAFKQAPGRFYGVMRDGIEIAGPSCVGTPAGFKTVEAAKQYAAKDAQP